MQHPGRVSFKFIDKMQLVSGFLLGKWDRKQGWLVAGPQIPSLPLQETAQEGPILLALVASNPTLGTLWDCRKAFCASVLQLPPGRAGCPPGNRCHFVTVSLQNDSICYVKAAFPLMGKILERTEFKENSSNARKMQMVRRMYNSIDENVDPCIRDEDDEERMVQ